MKTITKTSILLLCVIFLLFNNEINAQDYFSSQCEDIECDASFTAGVPNWPDIEEINVDPITGMPINPNDLEITSFLVEPNGLPDYAYFITGPVENGKRPIVDVTYDGTWDFKDADGQLVEEGDYCLTGFAYDQKDIKAYLDNIIVTTIFCQCSPDENCGDGVDSLHQIMDLLNNTSSICEEPIYYNIDTMLCLFRELLPIAIGYTPCLLTTEESFCFQMYREEDVSVLCGDVNAGIPNWPSVDTVYYDEANEVLVNANELEITSFSVEPTGLPDYTYFITGPIENETPPIVGISYDGTWDFKDADGQLVEEGEYCLTGLAYDQKKMSELLDNPLAAIILCQCSFDVNCGNELDSLHHVMDILNYTINSTCDEQTVYTIDTIIWMFENSDEFSLCLLPTEESFCFQLAEFKHPVNEIIINDDAIIIGTDTIYIGDEYLYTSNDSILIGTDTFLVFGMDTLFMNRESIEVGSYSIDLPNIGLTELNFGSANVFPNPVAEIFNIDFESLINALANIEIYDVSGRLIYSKVEPAFIGINQFSINAEIWNSGFYYAKISSENDVVAIKFLKE